MRLKLDLKPGVVSGGSAASGAGRFVDANLVRWVRDTIQPVGGWALACPTQVPGIARAAIAWRQNDYALRVAIGAHNGLHLLYGGNLYDITPAGFVAGRRDSVAGFGYSYGVYGASAYGGSGTPGESIDATVWSLDNWGQELVGCAQADGRLWHWTNDLASAAVAIPNSPVACQGLVVTPERHLIAYGAGGDKYVLQWCSSEDYTTWTPQATNSAGSLRLSSRTPIMSMLRAKGETLIFTDDELWGLLYRGYPYIYGAQRLAGGCGLAGPAAATVIEAGTVWMGRSGFFIYDGSVRAIECPILNDVVADINWAQRAKIMAAQVSRFGEVWWFYPSTNATENDSYAAWSSRTGVWSRGQLDRTAWIDAGVLKHAIGVDSAGHIYDQEQDWTAAGTPLLGQRYVRTGPIALENGAVTSHVRRLYSDSDVPMEVTFYGRDLLDGPATVYGPYYGAGRIDARLQARYVEATIKFLADSDWRVGSFELDAMPGGAR